MNPTNGRGTIPSSSGPSTPTKSGGWGDLDPEDRQANELALVAGERLLSVYWSVASVRFYVITECDRSMATIFLPEDR
jgi:hypothetical protein